MLAYFQRGSILCFENRVVKISIFSTMRNIWISTDKHDTYTKMTIRLVFSSSECSSPHATVFNFSRENKCFERAKVNSRCPTSFRPLCWYPSGNSNPTKHYDFEWYPLPNNSSLEYRTALKLWCAVYLLPFYSISFSWLHLLNVRRFYVFFA